MRIFSAPTSQLPPIGKVRQYSVEDLAKALRYLRNIYNPEVRGTRRVDTKERQTFLDAMRSDAFERSHAIRWLTAVVSQAYHFSDPSDTDSVNAAAQEILLQDAASLLAVCAGPASAGILSRTFRFLSEGGDISVQLTDIPLQNQDYSSVGAQTWGSSCLLAEMLAASPEKFILPMVRDGDIAYWRALELGAGTGLASITLAKLLERRAGNSAAHPATVVASDFHPSVLANLENNIKANLLPPVPNHTRLSVSTHFLDWSHFIQHKQRTHPFDEPFDLILGADIVYEVEHVNWIKACVEQLLRKPGLAGTQIPSAHFHLVIPLRPTHLLECRMVEEVFNFGDAERSDLTPSVPHPSHSLCIMSKDIITCEPHGDVRARGDVGAAEVEYVHYVIGWCADMHVHAEY
ncbi:putative methyltransferase-domain-containing protein [Sparassis latifolia]